MIKRMDITSAIGNPMKVLFVPANEQRPNFPDAQPVKGALIEFYDGRYPHTPDGQFICEYYTETLLESSSRYSDAGLSLHGGEPDWAITGRTKKLVLEWVLYHFWNGSCSSIT